MRDPLSGWSVKYKLALGFVGLCTLAFGVGGYLMSNSARHALVDQILQRLEFQSQAYAADLAGGLRLLTRRCEDFASDGYIRDHLARIVTAAEAAERSRLVAELHRHLEVNKLPLESSFSDLAVVTVGGDVVVAVKDDQSAMVREQAIWAIDQSGSSPSSEVVDDAGQPLVFLTTPILGLRSGVPIGRLLARVAIADWVAMSLGGDGKGIRLAGEVGPAEAVSLELIDPQGNRSRLPSPSSDRALGAAALRQQYPIGASGWAAEVSVDPERLMRPVFGLQSDFLMVGLVLAGLSALLLFFPLNFLAKPLTQMREAAQRIREGDFSARVTVRSADEVGVLAESFNLMAEAVEVRTRALEHTASELREGQKQLVAERDRLDRVISTMQDGLVVLDQDGRVELANHAAGPLLEMLRRMRQEEVGAHYPCTKRGANGHQDCRRCLTHPDLAGRSCTLDLGERVIDVHATPLPAGDDGRRGRILVGRDVTERVSREESEVHQERLAVLGEVAAVMAHELNNPLASISLFNQMLGERLPADSELQENVEVIQRNAESCKQVIGELLGYSASGNQESGEVEIHETLRDVARFLQPLAERNGVRIECQFEDQEAWLAGDEVQVRQIFVNLVVNAIQAGDDVQCVRLRSRRGDGVLRVSVEDDGPGIPPHLREQVFRPFFTTKARGEGTGLGLSTAKRLAELLGGGLELLRSGPTGCVFEVRLRLLIEEVPR